MAGLAGILQAVAAMPPRHRTNLRSLLAARAVRVLLVAALLWPMGAAEAQRATEARVALATRPRQAIGVPAVAPASARDGRSVARGAIIGGVIGGAVAAGLTWIVIESSDRDFGIDGIYYSILVPIGVGVGALIGAIAGANR